ncbi:MAG: aminotransferase class I/II-fold pyridoxal phosphate-dependent enzyme [Parasporobacterium sp.]|nr:aminotransferase class I/II-fold pyridoxal phosphate-dependent enzyme [Parasporobacterium sp.]
MLYQKNNLHGGDSYQEFIDLDYSVNLNPYGLSPAVRKAAAEALESACAYPDPFCRDLVAAIAAREQVPETQILCGNGAAELIYSFCSALNRLERSRGSVGTAAASRTGPDSSSGTLSGTRKAVIPAPTFAEYELGLKNAGFGVCRYFLDRRQGFLPDEGILEFILRHRPAAVFLCNPNNPDGQLIPRELLRKLLTLGKEQQFRIFLDECFIDLSDQGVSMKECLAEYPELFILKAFTKNYAMAGIRLGYGLCSDPELLKRMAETVQPWNVSVIAQKAGIAAMSDPEFPERARALIPSQREYLSRCLKDLGFEVCPSQANYLLFYGPTGLDAELRKRGIAIRDCSNYPGLGPGWYRIAVRLPEENRRLAGALKEAVRTLQKEP